MADKKIRPLGDRVLVLEEKGKSEKRTSTGIIIPETVKADDVKMAKVVAVGPGLYTQNGVLIPMTAKVGMEVVLPPYGQGQLIKLGGVDYMLYRESEFLAILEDEEQLELPL